MSQPVDREVFARIRRSLGQVERKGYIARSYVMASSVIQATQIIQSAHSLLEEEEAAVGRPQETQLDSVWW